MGDPMLLYITVGNREEGIRLGRELVSARLAACANVIDGMTSIFRWQDAVQEDAEVLMIAKTRSNLVGEATQLIKAEHSYDCPCVVALPIKDGNSDFLDWIVKETGPNAN